MAKVKLKDVRLSFPDLWVPTQYEGKGAFRYNASFLIEPGSANDIAVQEAIIAAATETYQKKATAVLESIRGNSNKFCYMKGDSKDYEGYAGMMVLASHRKQENGAPMVLGRDIDPELGLGEDGRPQLRRLKASDGKPYAGCYVNATADIYGQDGTHPGIRCGLLGVQFSRDGDAFSGAGRGDPADFEDLGEGADAESLV